MGLADELKSEVQTIFLWQWSTREGEVVPDTPDIKLGNDGVKLDATVLYADIDGSTNMVDSMTAHFSAEVYKSYLLCASGIIRSEGGLITAYDGDRVMAVFIGNRKNTSAVRCGLKIKAAVLARLPQLEADFRKIGCVGHGKFFSISAGFAENSEKCL